MRRTAPLVVNFMSRRVRWRVGSKLLAEATVKLDAKKGEKRCAEESPDRSVRRKAGVQITTHLNEDLGSNGMFLAGRCS